MLEIYYQRNDAFFDELFFSEKYAKLSKQRREKVDACKTQKARQQRLMAGYLLEKTIHDFGYHGELLYGESERGKPFLLEHHENVPQFSLSHAEDYSACVCAWDAVGVDVEAIDRYRESVAQRFFYETEEAYLRSLGEDEKQMVFAILWTVKEAIAKCLDEPLIEICKGCDASDYAMQALGDIRREEKETLQIGVPEAGELYLASFYEAGYVYTCVTTKSCGMRFEKVIDKS